MEWSLDPGTFAWIQHQILFKMDIDLFANYHNAKLPMYCSFRPDPGAKFIDTFSIDWAPFTPFIFCPFRMLLAVLRKLRDNQVVRVGIIMPLWFSAPWWVNMIEMLAEVPLMLPPDTMCKLRLPWDSDKLHPLAIKGTTRVLFVTLSAQSSLKSPSLRTFMRSLQVIHGDPLHPRGWMCVLAGGWTSVRGTKRTHVD